MFNDERARDVRYVQVQGVIKLARGSHGAHGCPLGSQCVARLIPCAWRCRVRSSLWTVGWGKNCSLT